MSFQEPTPPPAYPPPGQAAPEWSAAAAPGWGGPPVPYPPAGTVGKVRGTGVCILLTVVTLGIYPLVWWFQTHEEMKRHSGQGLGGLVALLLALFVGIAMPYVSSSEVGNLYERRGQAPPVTAATGLWYFPGMFILVGPLVWFVRTNNALNAYWQSLGAR